MATNTPLLTLQSINMEWATSVSLEQFKNALAHYQHQNLEALYNEANGLVNKAEEGDEGLPPNASLNNNPNGNGNSNTKKVPTGQRKRSSRGGIDGQQG